MKTETRRGSSEEEAWSINILRGRSSNQEGGQRAGSHLKTSALKPAPPLLLLERRQSLRAPRRALPLLPDRGGSARPQGGQRGSRVGPLSDGEQKVKSTNTVFGKLSRQKRKYLMKCSQFGVDYKNMMLICSYFKQMQFYN